MLPSMLKAEGKAVTLTKYRLSMRQAGGKALQRAKTKTLVAAIPNMVAQDRDVLGHRRSARAGGVQYWE
jgi:hypothetical protein